MSIKTYSELQEYCTKQGYWVEVLVKKTSITITVYYGDAWKDMGAESEFQRLSSGSDSGEKPSINAAAKKCGMMLKVFEKTRAKWWETDGPKRRQDKSPIIPQGAAPIRSDYTYEGRRESYDYNDDDNNYYDPSYRGDY